MKKKDLGLFGSIRNVVKKVPKGKVATYGQIASMAGTRDARKVGWALWGNSDPKISCHRVVNREGFLAARFSLGGWREQKRRLLPEGIKFKKVDRVDLSRHLWKG